MLPGVSPENEGLTLAERQVQALLRGLLYVATNLYVSGGGCVCVWGGGIRPIFSYTLQKLCLLMNNCLTSTEQDEILLEGIIHHVL